MTDDYHRDNGDGGDFYSVKKSRGCGGVAIWAGDKPFVSRNFATSRVLTQRPLRLVFELGYAPFEAGAGVKVTETKRITLDAGKNFNRVASTFKVEGGTPALAVGVGIGKKPGADLKSDKHWIRTWEPLNDGNGTAGCAVVLAPGTTGTVKLDRPRHAHRRQNDPRRAVRLLLGVRLEQASAAAPPTRQRGPRPSRAGPRARRAGQGHAVDDHPNGQKRQEGGALAARRSTHRLGQHRRNPRARPARTSAAGTAPRSRASAAASSTAATFSRAATARAPCCRR